MHVLVAAGLVAQERRGRTRYCRLEREPLQQAGGWIANYADFWRGQLDSLAPTCTVRHPMRAEGGAYRIAMVEPAGGERVEFPWSSPAGDSRVALSLAESDGGTRVSLVHSAIAAADQDERYEQGRQGFLANLKSVLEGGGDNRSGDGVRTLA